MTEALPPHPDRWKPATIALKRDADGTLCGSMCIYGVVWHLRGWTKAVDGVIACQAQPLADAAFMALMSEILGEA